MNVAPPSWIQTMLNSIDSFCHQLAYKNISVMFFFFVVVFLNKHFVRFWFENIIFSDFGFLSSPTKNVLLRCVVQQPQRQPGRSNLCCHGNISHVRACEVFWVCVRASAVFLANDRHSCLLSSDVWRDSHTHTHTHTQDNQQNKRHSGNDWGGIYVCVCA